MGCGGNLCAKQESGMQQVGWELKGNTVGTRETGRQGKVKLDTINKLGLKGQDWNFCGQTEMGFEQGQEATQLW